MARHAESATEPRDGDRHQLATLLGQPPDSIGRIRITDEIPPRISAIDLASVMTGKDTNHAAQDIGYLKDRFPEVTQILGDFRFKGQGQRKIAVTGANIHIYVPWSPPGPFHS